MKKITKSLALITILILLPVIIYARQGCCSHHGGVCGCRCCDGTSLSAKCAPYYPQCNANTKSTIEKIDPIIEQSASIDQIVKKSIKNDVNPNKEESNFFGWIILLLFILGIYYYNRKSKQ